MKKFLIVLCVLAVCSITLAEEQKVQEQKKEEKPDYRSVIVDAWLVQVSADALYESGVKPLSAKDKENVSIMNLLWCLGDPNNGKIVVSATTRARVNADAENKFNHRIERARPATNDWLICEQEIGLVTRSYILESKQVCVEWSFRSSFVDDKTMNKFPPDTSSVDCKNITVVSVQKPVIVAQTQIGDDMFFLVLRVEIVE